MIRRRISAVTVSVTVSVAVETCETVTVVIEAVHPCWIATTAELVVALLSTCLMSLEGTAARLAAIKVEDEADVDEDGMEREGEGEGEGEMMTATAPSGEVLLAVSTTVALLTTVGPSITVVLSTTVALPTTGSVITPLSVVLPCTATTGYVVFPTVPALSSSGFGAVCTVIVIGLCQIGFVASTIYGSCSHKLSGRRAISCSLKSQLALKVDLINDLAFARQLALARVIITAVASPYSCSSVCHICPLGTGQEKQSR